ncbi:hypothetical protein NP233_g1435 [Leucocoprinus birnbaumii]|uniref:Uncharacterized protein n=1 Tax=Leucocoprinus birnbaumii TaxID=56174 RepID=A0AAD5W267_9AGAR|nr:hypothetical protein NP233_g1435 [Leucocoprinus birnbaumii]
MTTFVNKTFDDTSPVLNWLGDWVRFTDGMQLQTPNGSLVSFPLYNNSGSYTSLTNVALKFVFPENARAIYGYGALLSGSYQTSIDCTIDCASYEVHMATVNPGALNGSTLLFSYQFSSPNIHIMRLGANDSRVIIDRFDLEVAVNTTATAPVPTSTSPKETHSPLGSAVVGTHPIPAGKEPPVAAIVGGTLGGLVVFISALSLYLFYRRRRSSRPAKPLIEPAELSFIPHPFSFPQSPPPTQDDAEPSDPESFSPWQSTDFSSNGMSTVNSNLAAERRRRVFHEMDAGPVYMNGFSRDDVVQPPLYERVFQESQENIDGQRRLVANGEEVVGAEMRGSKDLKRVHLLAWEDGGENSEPR